MKLVSIEDITLACLKIWEICEANENNPLNYTEFLKKTSGKLNSVISEKTPYVTWINDSEYILNVDSGYLLRLPNPNQFVFRGLIDVIQNILLKFGFSWVRESKFLYQELLASFIMCPAPIFSQIVGTEKGCDKNKMCDTVLSKTCLTKKEVSFLFSAYGFDSHNNKISLDENDRIEITELKEAILIKVGINKPSVEEIIKSFDGEIKFKRMFERLQFDMREDKSFVIYVRDYLNRKVSIFDALVGFGNYFFEENGLSSNTKRIALAELLLKEIRED